MYKIAIFQSDMRVGGIQRSLANLLKYMTTRKDICIHVFIADGRDIFYELPECDGIKYFYLNTLPYINRLLPFGMVKALWGGHIRSQILAARGDNQADMEYDLAIDFNSYWSECALGTILVKAKKRVCFVHNDVAIKMKEEIKYKILHSFFKKKYAFFDQMVLVSEGLIEPFYQINPHAPKNYVVLNNAIDTDEIKNRVKNEVPEEAALLAIDDIKKHPDRVEIVSVGRLSHQKGYDILIDYASRVCSNIPKEEIHFTIIGDGPLKHDIIKLLEEKGLTSYFTLTGNLQNPFPIMAMSDAFVLCSRYEGQGIVLLEAKALGLPVIIPQRLEKYTGGIEGVLDVEKALREVEKRQVRGNESFEVDELCDYKLKWNQAFSDILDEKL